MNGQQAKELLKRVWRFIWHDDSIWSWIVNIILAFVLIRFIVFPGLGLALDTTHPVVAVISESMEHDGGFDTWWADQHQWYGKQGITKEEFSQFPFADGFNKGDIMFLAGKAPEKLRIGDVLVFQTGQPQPIIHRIVRKWQEGGKWHFQTKGDHNKDSIKNGPASEMRITEEQVVGRAVFRVPYLGWLKIAFVNALKALGAPVGLLG